MSSAARHSSDNSITQFFIDAHRVISEAHFIINSLPNAEMPAVTRVVKQLYIVQSILVRMEDPYTSPEELNSLLSLVSNVLEPLEAFLSSPPPPPSSHLPRENTGSKGRPTYILDLPRIQQLHNLGNSWSDIASALGVDRKTLYNHMRTAGLATARPEHTNLTDDELDEIVAEISISHPFVGSTIVRGHLKSRGIDVSMARVRESLSRVDAIGVLVRWAGIIKRRVYKVRGSNALWHMDGNEKLKPWGFYVHGCIDGFSRLIIYLVCCSNKRARTVSSIYRQAVNVYGWPSRARGDFGTENNEVEGLMIEHWGQAHHAFLRGRSLHNVRIERLWRDVRKDSLEVFRQIFMYLEEIHLLDMDLEAHRVCLFLVFHKRIQDSLDRTRHAWNHHQLRTEHHRTPVALYELSRTQAMTQGYWTGDPGDPAEAVQANNLYGVDKHAPPPPVSETHNEPRAPRAEPSADNVEELRSAGIVINDDEELQQARTILPTFDFNRDDGNWGIEVYIEAVTLYLAASAGS